MESDIDLPAVGGVGGSVTGVGSSDAVGGSETGVGGGETGVGSGGITGVTRCGVGGSNSGTGGGNSASGGCVGLGGGNGVLVGGKASPVGVLVEVSVGFSNLTDCLSVVLDRGLCGTGLAFTPGAGVVLGGYVRVDGSCLRITSVDPVD